MPGGGAGGPQRGHVEAEKPNRAEQPPVRRPHGLPGSLEPGREPAYDPRGALPPVTARNHDQRGERQHADGDQDRYPGMAQVMRSTGQPEEQKHAGHAVDEEPEGGEQAQEGGTALDQRSCADAVSAHQQTGGGSRRDVAAGQYCARTHGYPGHLATVRTRWLGEEPAKDDHVAEARGDFQADRDQHPGWAHVTDLIDHALRRRHPQQQANRNDSDDRGN